VQVCVRVYVRARAVRVHTCMHAGSLMYRDGCSLFFFMMLCCWCARSIDHFLQIPLSLKQNMRFPLKSLKSLLSGATIQVLAWIVNPHWLID